MALIDFSLKDVGETLVKAREALTGKRVIDDLEAQKLENELEQIQQQFEATVTERWKSDNENPITQLVRPVMVIWTFILFTAVVLFDGNLGTFIVKPAYIPLLETVMTTIVIAYFGSRGIEKVFKYKK
jgi:hypothetical protein